MTYVKFLYIFTLDHNQKLIILRKSYSRGFYYLNFHTLNTFQWCFICSICWKKLDIYFVPGPGCWVRDRVGNWKRGIFLLSFLVSYSIITFILQLLGELKKIGGRGGKLNPEVKELKSDLLYFQCLCISCFFLIFNFQCLVFLNSA